MSLPHSIGTDKYIINSILRKNVILLEYTFYPFFQFLMGFLMQISIPFLHNILSPHPQKHSPHHLMFQGRTSEKNKGQGKPNTSQDTHNFIKAHHTKQETMRKKDTELVSGTSNSFPV